MSLGKREIKYRIQKRIILSLIRPEQADNENLENIGSIHKIETLASFLGISGSQTKKLMSKIFLDEEFSKKDNVSLTEDTYNCCSLILSQQEVIDLLTAIFVSTLNLGLKQRITIIPSVDSLKIIGAKFYKGFSTTFIEDYCIHVTDYIDYTYDRLRYLSRIVSSENEKMRGVLFSYLEEFKHKSKGLQNYQGSMDAYYVIFSIPQIFVILNSLARTIEWENLKSVKQPSFYREEWAYNTAAIILRGVEDQLLPTIDRFGDAGQDILVCIREQLIKNFSNDVYCKQEMVNFLEKSETIAKKINKYGSNCIQLDPPCRKTEGLKYVLIDVSKSGHKLDVKADGKILRKSILPSTPSDNKATIVSLDRNKRREKQVDIDNIEDWEEFIERKR